jgi:hypothetical protein
MAAVGQSETLLVRVDLGGANEAATFYERGYRVLHDELPGVVDLIVDEAEYRELLERDYEIKILMPYEHADGLDIDPEYHTYEELTVEMQALASQYPSICRLDSIGRATAFPRTIWCMKLSDNAETEEDEMAVFYFGTHHGAEPMGCETALYMIDHFLTNYGSDPQITTWMDNYEIFIVPLVNPDGHHAVVSDYHLCWRKNARDLNRNGVYYEYRGSGGWDDITEGVDLNRNYDYYWSTGGPSDPRSNNYIGPAAFSERELQAIRDLGYAQHFVCGISFHSYGEIVLYPWYGPPLTPDHAAYTDMAQVLARGFVADSGGTYDYDLAWGQSGQCRNWFYAVLGAFGFCVELNPTGITICPGLELAERNQRYMEGAVYLFERLSGPGITGHVTDFETGLPLAANVEVVGLTSDQVRPRYADPLYGRFTRFLLPGTYTLQVLYPGYISQQIEHVTVGEGMTELVIEMVATGSDDAEAPGSGRENLFEVERLEIEGLSASFSFDLPVAGVLKLQVYNLLGQRVGMRSFGHLGTGVHQIGIDLPALAAGVYLYRLEAGKFTASGKMVLMK